MKPEHRKLLDAAYHGDEGLEVLMNDYREEYDLSIAVTLLFLYGDEAITRYREFGAPGLILK